MTEHELKLAPWWFDAVADGSKNFEVRRDDRGFAVGDTLVLYEYHAIKGYTGRECKAEVTFILHSKDFPAGIVEGYCVMGIHVVETEAVRCPHVLLSSLTMRTDVTAISWSRASSSRSTSPTTRCTSSTGRYAR